MNQRTRHTIYGLVVACAVLLNVTSANAEDTFVDVLIPNAKAEGVTVAGILQTYDGVMELTSTEVEETTRGLLVRVSYDSEIAPEGSTMTAVAVTGDGKRMFGEVRPTFALENPDAALTLPECPAEHAPPVLQSQIATIENLVKLRLDQRDNRRESVQNELQGDFLDRLRQFEVGFGLRHDTELSGDLDPVELVDRLSRILHAVNNYSVHQSRRQEATQ